MGGFGGRKGTKDIMELYHHIKNKRINEFLIKKKRVMFVKATYYHLSSPLSRKSQIQHLSQYLCSQHMKEWAHKLFYISAM